MAWDHSNLTIKNKQKVRKSTSRPFRIGNRRKPTSARPTTRATYTTSTSSPNTRPTKISRRKYPSQSTSTRTLESQETTTTKPKVETRFRFVSRKPLLRTTTTRRTEDITETIKDQASESSNQQSLEEDFDGGKTTELADIALVLHNLQQAPLPSLGTTSKIPEISHDQSISVISRVSIPNTTFRVTNKPFITDLQQTTQRISTRKPSRVRTRYSTTIAPLSLTSTTKLIKQKTRPQAFEKINPANSDVFRSPTQYDYYDDIEASIIGKIPEHSKVLLHENGVIECLDQGNFPHPISCKKFISCAKMENGKVLGWEYTCPKNLSFDPIGGICNWSAGLGCNER